jgi:hypothetical protein
VINEIEASNSNLETGIDCDLEFEAMSVEVGDKFVVINDDLEMAIHSILLFTTTACIGVNKHLMMIGAILGTKVI